MCDSYRRIDYTVESGKVLCNGVALGADRIVELLNRHEEARREAEGLAVTLWSLHYRHCAPEFNLCDSVVGVITQIDNMTAGMVPSGRKL